MPSSAAVLNGECLPKQGRMNMPSAVALVVFAVLTAMFPATAAGPVQPIGQPGLQKRGAKVATTTYKGTYSNPNYWYSVRIPANLVARGAAASAPNHGITISLSGRLETPERFMSVYAYYDAAQLGSVEKIVEREIADFRKDNKDVLVESSKHETVEGLRAVHRVLKYKDSTGQAMVREDITILRTRRGQPGIEYDIALQTTSWKYRTDVVQFTELLQTFRLDPLD
jgi:hypothetical protein